MISTIAGSALTYSGGQNVAATSAGFGLPAGVVRIGSNGNIAISDSQANCVRLVTVSSGIISDLAGTGSASLVSTLSNGDGGKATSGSLNYPFGMTETLNFVLVADRFNMKIRRIDTVGNIMTLKAGEQYCIQFHVYYPVTMFLFIYFQVLGI
jgi:hypothetical protein